MRAWSREWLRREGGQLDDLAKLRRLLERLIGQDGSGGREGLAIREVTEPTPTAAEAFQRRQADCVGFALLLGSLARSAGVSVEFALISRAAVDGGVDPRLALHFRREHLAVTHSGRVFDLGGETAFDPEFDRTIGERTATALFFSNRGAQSLAAGRLEDSIELFWRALRFDTSLPAIWTNLGVALRRTGDPVGAVLAHEMALRLDPRNAPALQNLGIAQRPR